MAKKSDNYVDPSVYSVFMPKSQRGLIIDYPELKGYTSFRALSNLEMLFVWYFACESSPYYKVSSDRERVQKALDVSYNRDPRSKKIFGKAEQDYLSGNFPGKISSAIEDMKKFRVGPRIRAKMMAEKIMDNYEKILDIDASNTAHFQNKDGEVDFTKKKAYVDTAAKALEVLPSLIKQIEHNFGLSEDKKGGEVKTSAIEGRSLIDEFHEKED
jgi:hypothetical protein